MAKQYRVKITKTRKVMVGKDKQGKPIYKKQKYVVGEKAKNTNLSPSKLGNEYQTIMNKHTEKMANIAGKTTNISQAIGQLGNSLQAITGNNNLKNNSTVIDKPTDSDSLINGGMQSSTNQRDEDEGELIG